MIKKYFKKSNSARTQRANKNIILSMFFRGGSILLQFTLIPLTINYIKPDVYGVWLTLSSLVGWLAMLDVGIANGLRNKLSESLAIEDFEKAKVFVSTTYVIISIIAIVLVFLFILGFQWVNWQAVFNSNFILESELENVVIIVSLFFLLKFVTDIINVVAASFQMVSVSSILLFISNLGLTISVWILTKTTDSNLILLALCLSVIPFLISLGANFYFFRSRFKAVKPSFKNVDFKLSKSIVSLGSQFFILQIIGLIIFQTDNILIAQFFNPSEVTNFNIAYKYYSVVIILFTILLTPFWTAFTEAYHKNDFDWIKLSIKKLLTYWLLSVVVLVIMLFMANWLIKLWVGDAVEISFSLSLSICAYITVSNWNAIFASFSNGVGKLRVQIYYAMIMGILNIPLCFVLVKIFHFGTFAMPLSNFFCLSLGAVISYIQYVKIVNGRATGIWNK
jgi:O-antigen/teichoic acid export membrane protein